MQQIFPGIWKLTLGTPEAVTPVATRHKAPAEAGLAALPAGACPFPAEAIRGEATPRGYRVSLPLAMAEQVYGFGLQLLSFNQRGKKKTLRVNSDPRADLGDSHAPVPFYVTTQGYGVLIDTARYATVYCGCAKPRRNRQASVRPVDQHVIASSTDELYAARNPETEDRVIVEIPVAAGVDIYLFAGPGMREAVQRYNLFSGGGALPPRWGLGVWYRCKGDFTQEQTLAMARGLREDGMPCDVLGLEPGWQTHAYSCTFQWSERFPDPRALTAQLAAAHYRLNLWTHAFVHPTSPLYQPLLPFSGDYEVWQGLVPDLVQAEARQRMAAFFAQEHLAVGVAGYKLDECDNSDFISFPWSFPEISRFPSGVDGEQMHSLFGRDFAEMVEEVYRPRDQRAYHQVRSLHALAAPYPFVLYSDLYNHTEFLRALVNSGFTGLLWSPEVRDARDAEDLVRRLQSVVLSPQALINSWYIKNPPWKQWETPANNADRFAEDWPRVQEICRQVLSLRMQLLPYLSAAFFRYALEGLPPFRALVMDYPEDEQVWKLDNEYLIGDRLLAAPVVAGQTAREIYLPAGEWVDFWTGTVYAGGQTITLPVPLETTPLFVKQHSLLPLAAPTLHADDPAGLSLTVRVYGDGRLPITLYEDDDRTYSYQHGRYNCLTLCWDGTHGQATREGDHPGIRYRVEGWQQ